ncbi:subunit beta of translation initiation factor 2 [Hamiltosporidium tvaerminnensis]|uniref:Subunit beta of translation initiation factor 2 n=1 Tax=Hamiltosporidium tvaerminnensis TaxID=1176355 RepID=A0A4Q9M0C6_9MICR|nr:subunit beta of translation initiation factor 2 [Hamiltosporidium tvaerminnensis]
MKRVDIDRNNKDPFYRYKMPGVMVKIEGKGNGIKTVIVNLEEIAHSLRRKAVHILKFISYELGSISFFDSKNGRYIVNGSHDTNKVQAKIYDFIEIYVMCEVCRNPETFFVYEKTLKKECLACGNSCKVDGHTKVDNIVAKDLENDSSFSERDKSYYDLTVNIGDQNMELKNDLKSLLDANCSAEDIYKCFMDNKESIDIFYQKVFQIIENNPRKILACSILINERKDGCVEIFKALEIYSSEKKSYDFIFISLQAILDNKIVKRSECFKYFQTKSKYVSEEDSMNIRKALSPLWD